MKVVKFALQIVLLAVFISSCKVGNQYERPELGIPGYFNGEWDENEADSTLLSNLSWREFFNDPMLVELIDSGLVYNYDMRKALKNIEIANLHLQSNKFEYLPQVNANIATINQQFRSENFYSSALSKWYGDEESPSSLFKYQSQHATGLEFSWELDVWGRIAQQKDILKADWLQSQEAKTAIQTKLISDIANGYFNLLILNAQMEVAKRNLQLNDSTLQMIRLQFDAGETTALAIQQTESQRLVAASMIPALEAQIASQQNILRTLIGKMPGPIEHAETLGDSLINTNQITIGAPLNIIRLRPDIKQAELKLISANAAMNIRQIMRYPQLSLSSVFGVNAMLPENWFNIPGALLGGVIGQISAPVFRSKKLKNQYEQAILDREKAELDFQEQVMLAVTEISNTLIIIEKQKEQLILADNRVENSKLAVRNASLLFRSGYASYLEVITAQSNALRSELDLVDIKQKQLNAYVALYRSLGGGWK